MPSITHEVRALLLQFERSPLRDLYWRGHEWSVFMAREGGAANPMLAAAEPQPVVAVVPPISIAAPHLGLFEPDCAIGQTVERGGLIGRIDVLGRKTDVFSAQAGRVVAICAPTNGLVEFGDALVDIAA